MEPLSALGLAACIAQFPDFGSSLVKETREISKHGRSITTEHLSGVTTDLLAITSGLTKHVDNAGTASTPLGAPDEVSPHHRAMC